MPKTKLNPTEGMIEQLKEIEEVLEALDQHASSHGPHDLPLRRSGNAVPHRPGRALRSLHAELPRQGTRLRPFSKRGVA